MPLGVTGGEIFQTSLEIDKFTFEKGDVFVQYTDGITEGMNPAKEEYGLDRFVESIEKYS